MSDQDRNFDAPSKDLALQQIFNATGYLVPASKIDFGHPEVVDPFPRVDVDENTFVPAEIDPFENARFNGDNGFLYRRMSLDELPANPSIPSIPVVYPFKVHDVLPLISSFLGTQLDETDVENDEFAAAPVVLRVKEGSLAWIGKRTIVPVNPNHQYLVKNPFLNGFKEYVWEDPLPEPLKPYLGLSKTRLVALINENVLAQVPATPAIVEGTDFTFGNITTIFTDEYNTRIRLRPVNTGLYVEQDLFYNRLSLEVLTRLPAGAITPVDILQVPFTIHGILAKINQALDLNLLASEVVNTHYATREDTYRVQVLSGASLAWLPSYFDFTANHTVPENARLLEDGTPRLLEDGSFRLLEDPVVTP